MFFKHAFLTLRKSIPQSLLQIQKNQSYQVQNYCSDHACRFQYAPESEAQVNVQIGLELSASHTYLSIANFYARTTVGLEGCAGYKLHNFKTLLRLQIFVYYFIVGFFLNMSNEERGHAFKLMQFQNMRGGHVRLCDIPKPEKEEWTSIKESLEHSVQLERYLTTSLIELKNVAKLHQDVVLEEFIISEFLIEQV